MEQSGAGWGRPDTTGLALAAATDARRRLPRRPTPGGGPGTLTVIDNRTGKRYEVPISDHGTIKATDLKLITAGGDGTGLRTFDNGYGAAGQRLAYCCLPAVMPVGLHAACCCY